jgi:hypothetical protein
MIAALFFRAGDALVTLARTPERRAGREMSVRLPPRKGHAPAARGRSAQEGRDRAVPEGPEERVPTSVEWIRSEASCVLWLGLAVMALYISASATCLPAATRVATRAGPRCTSGCAR